MRHHTQSLLLISVLGQVLQALAITALLRAFPDSEPALADQGLTMETVEVKDWLPFSFLEKQSSEVTGILGFGKQWLLC